MGVYLDNVEGVPKPQDTNDFAKRSNLILRVGDCFDDKAVSQRRVFLCF